jgi:transposase InsO family protein
MAEMSRLISVKQLMTTPYHPMGNGFVERVNGTLKLKLERYPFGFHRGQCYCLRVPSGIIQVRVSMLRGITRVQ